MECSSSSSTACRACWPRPCNDWPVEGACLVLETLFCQVGFPHPHMQGSQAPHVPSRWIQAVTITGTAHDAFLFPFRSSNGRGIPPLPLHQCLRSWIHIALHRTATTAGAGPVDCTPLCRGRDGRLPSLRHPPYHLHRLLPLLFSCQGRMRVWRLPPMFLPCCKVVLVPVVVFKSYRSISPHRSAPRVPRCCLPSMQWLGGGIHHRLPHPGS